MLSKAQLQRALLSIKEVPAGYAADQSGDDGSNDSYCGYKPPSQPTEKVRSDYVKGGGFSSQLISFSIGQYKSQDGPKGYLRDFAKQLRKCPSETLDGEFVKYAVMSAPQVGDETLGVRIEAESYTVVANLARVGPVLMVVGGGGVTNTDADEVGRLFVQQVKKYLRAARN